MSETDPEAMLLENIEGKYGDGSDYDDLGNADEDALLADDAEFLTIRHSHLYDDTNEELDHEPEEADTEDVLDLEAQDVELDEDLEEKNAQLSQSANSLSQTDLENSILNDSIDNREREDKFKNEREVHSAKSYPIPNSLDQVQVLTSSVPTIRNNLKRNMNQFKNRGRGGNHSSRNAQNQTVLINPHFKGHVKINNNARLAWDARQRINQKNNQVGRIAPFMQNRNPNQNIAPIQPWIGNNSNNNHRGPTPNLPQFQQQQLPPQYQPQIPHPPQVPVWNQYQPNSFNEVPPQMPINNNQVLFMQPIPQNVYPNQQMQPQFNQPPPQFGPYNTSIVYSNSIQNSGFGNNQFIPPSNQFNHQMESSYMDYSALQQNQYPNVSVNSNQFNHQVNPFNNNNRVIRQKSNFAHSQKMNKRKPDSSEVKRKKRNLTSTNLHEVHTVESCDTTVKEERHVQQDEEDEETRQYRLKIEEQKRKREEIFKLKEERRLKAIQNGSASDTVTVKTEPVQLQKPIIQKKKMQNIRPNQPARQGTGPIWMQQQATTRSEQVCNSNININTSNDESNYDKLHLASFLANRKILTKDQSLIDTSIVVMTNLSAGTTEIKLRKMCQGIGDIKKLQMSLKERQATIQFNSVASAHAFFKKYQRTMLDLSMIQVSLKPMS